MAIHIENKSIRTSGYILENWGRVNWLIKVLEANAELLWGKREGKPETKAATVLKLVARDPEAS